MSGATWLPAWYQASNRTKPEPRTDFLPTEIEVDYVRVYAPSSGSSANP